MEEEMKGVIVVILFFLSCSVFSQTILLKQKVDEPVYEEEEFGPNRKRYAYPYEAFGFMFGPADSGARIHNWSSFEIAIGNKFKRQFGQTYALLFGYNFNVNSFRLKQVESKLLPDNVIHKKERYTFYNFQVDLVNRIHFLERGDNMGRWIDLGGYANYNFINRHMFITEDSTGVANEIRMVEKGLDYVNKLQYGLHVSVGVYMIELYAKYRLSDWFEDTQDKDFPELPRLTFGLQLDLTTE